MVVSVNRFLDAVNEREGIIVEVWECRESGDLIEGDQRVCDSVMGRDSGLHWRLVNSWREI